MHHHTPDLFATIHRPAPLPGPAVTAVAGLHFWRCRVCLSVITTQERPSAIPCECAGAFEYLGRAEQDRLIRTELRCPCDERCTSARGPHCNCRCGGRNHGSDLLVPVRVDAGRVLPVRPPDRQGLARAKEYRDACAAARAAIEARHPALQRMADGGWIESRTEWREAVDAAAALRKARGYLVHGVRMRALRSLIRG